MTDLPAHVTANPRLGTLGHRGARPDGDVVEVRVGKAELGQGIATALAQLAADALGLPLDRVRMVAPHTALGPDQGLTAGSLSVLQSGPALAHVGGVVRALAGPTSPVEEYVARIAAPRPRPRPHHRDPARAASTPARSGRSEPRLDLPDKVLGRPRFLADLRPDGLLHGRVLRPPSVGAVLRSVPDGWKAPGVDARPRRLLPRRGRRARGRRRPGPRAARPRRRVGRARPAPRRRPTSPAGCAPAPTRRSRSSTRAAPPGRRTTVVEASYSRPFLAHGSIAPSAGLAVWTDDGVHVRSHSQGIHGLRDAIATALGLDRATVVVEHVENAGCYGHNAADDAAFDAVLLARAVPGRPVLLRWTRPDELTWGPLSSAMTATVRARLDGGRIAGWSYDVWSQGHTARPGYAGTPGLLAGSHLADAAGAAAPDRPAAGRRWRHDPQRGAGVRRGAAARRRPPQDGLADPHLRDAGARRAPQRVRDRVVHRRARPRRRRRPGRLPARPPVRPAGAPRREPRPPGSPAGASRCPTTPAAASATRATRTGAPTAPSSPTSR